jgi:hypothetical protein
MRYLQQQKDQVAQENGFKDWNDFFMSAPSFSEVERLMELSAILFIEQEQTKHSRLAPKKDTLGTYTKLQEN